MAFQDVGFITSQFRNETFIAIWNQFKYTFALEEHPSLQICFRHQNKRFLPITVQMNQEGGSKPIKKTFW